MAIRYSTNWMGPVSMDWYRERGLTRRVTKVVTEDSILVELGRRKVGDVLEYDEITTHYAGGRIDIYGEGLGPHGDEMSLPIMRGDCWNQFSEWLETFETDDVWTLDQLVELYERKNPKIVWAKED